MRKLFLLLLPLVFAANCSAPAAQTVEPNPDKYFKPVTSDIVGSVGDGNTQNPSIKPGDPFSPFNADKTLKPQFPDGTLLRLNAIVRRTMETIDKYDDVRPGIEKLVAASKAAPGDAALAAKAAAGIDEVRALQAEAIASRKDLTVEGQKLVDSKQYYDQVVFSGMATFVTRVENEFANDLKRMAGDPKP